MRGFNGFFRGCSYFFGGGFGIWRALLFAGVIIIIALLWRGRKKSYKVGAIESLKVLYVKGEITEEEYLNRKNVIERK